MHDEDVGGEDLVADRRPGVTVAHVLPDAGLDVVVDDADELAADVVLRQLREHREATSTRKPARASAPVHST